MPVTITGAGTASGVTSVPNLQSFPAGPRLANVNMPVGAVLQVVQSTLAGTQAFSGSSAWTDVTSLTATITPTSSASKFLLMFSIMVAGDNNTWFRFVRNGSAVGVGNADGVKQQASSGNGYFNYTGNAAQLYQLSGQYLDSPSTGSAITYKMQLYCDSGGGTGTTYINYNGHEGNVANFARTMSTFTVMEIAQ
jgi:hypothetical protein